MIVTVFVSGPLQPRSPGGQRLGWQGPAVTSHWHRVSSCPQFKFASRPPSGWQCVRCWARRPPVTVTGSCPGPVTRARAGAADRRLLSPCGDPSESDLQGSQLASEVAAGAGRSSPPGPDRRRAARAAGRCNLRLSAASHTGIPTELLPTEPESAQPESRCHSHGVPGPGAGPPSLPVSPRVSGPTT